MIKKYNPKVIRGIMEEYGVDEAEAVQIASATMDGADTTPEGYINSTQTACPTLKYGEALPPSEGQKEGKKVTTDALQQFIVESGLELNPGEDPAEAWLRLNSGPETGNKKR